MFAFQARNDCQKVSAPRPQQRSLAPTHAVTARKSPCGLSRNTQKQAKLYHPLHFVCKNKPFLDSFNHNYQPIHLQNHAFHQRTTKQPPDNVLRFHHSAINLYNPNRIIMITRLHPATSVLFHTDNMPIQISLADKLSCKQ